MDEPAPNTMSTEALTQQVDILNKMFTEFRAERLREDRQRHELNAKLGVTLMETGNRWLGAQDAIATLTRELRDGLSMVKDLSTRLVGNEVLKQPGLVGEVVQLRTELKGFCDATNDRMEAMEKAVNATNERVSRISWLVGGASALVVGVAATLAWVVNVLLPLVRAANTGGQ